MEDHDDIHVVSRFEHENALWHYNMCNRRMLIALIVVCITFISTIIVFVNGYTAREKHWLDTLTYLRTSTAVMEVQADGVLKQPGS